MSGHQTRQTLEVRVRQLESGLRVAAWGWVLAVIIAVLGLTVSHTISAPAILKARGLEFVDGADRPRIVLEVAKNGDSRVALSDQRGRLRAVLNARDVQVQFVVYDQGGRPRAALGMSEQGPSLRLFDRALNSRVGMDVANEEGTPRIFLNDGSDRARIELAVQDDVSFTLLDRSHAPRLEASLTPDGTPGLSLNDEKQMPRLRLGTTTEGLPWILLSDSKGHAVFRAP